MDILTDKNMADAISMISDGLTDPNEGPAVNELLGWLATQTQQPTQSTKPTQSMQKSFNSKIFDAINKLKETIFLNVNLKFVEKKDRILKQIDKMNQLIRSLSDDPIFDKLYTLTDQKQLYTMDKHTTDEYKYVPDEKCIIIENNRKIYDAMSDFITTLLSISEIFPYYSRIINTLIDHINKSVSMIETEYIEIFYPIVDELWKTFKDDLKIKINGDDTIYTIGDKKFGFRNGQFFANLYLYYEADDQKLRKIIFVDNIDMITILPNQRK